MASRARRTVGSKAYLGQIRDHQPRRRRFAAHPFSAEDGARIDAIGQGAGGHWSRRRQLDSRTARGAARRSRAFCLRLSRGDPNAARRDDRPPLRDSLPGYALARLLCLDLPAWRDDERRVRQREEGILAENFGPVVAKRLPAFRTHRRSAARARRFRPSPCPAGTTGAMSCWPETPPAWSRRRRARASTMRCWADDWRRRRRIRLS